MQNQVTTDEWREKVNPLFVTGLQFLKFLSRLLREIHETGDFRRQAPILFIEFCKNGKALLPISQQEGPDVEHDIAQLAASFESEVLVNPEVRRALAELLVNIGNSPEALLGKGFEKPHWWMGQASWAEFLETEPGAQSLFNVLSLLHFKMPFDELTQRVTDGDPEISAKLFRFDSKELLESAATSEHILEGINDRARKIVGRALLFRGEPPGYQLPLRMVLFFGWDFGLRDLANDELYAFLTELHIIPTSYDPESLRKLRSRLLALIRNSSKSVDIDKDVLVENLDGLADA